MLGCKLNYTVSAWKGAEWISGRTPPYRAARFG